MLQLCNKAASGDLKAIRELHNWTVSLANFEQADISDESDPLVMANILMRIRASEDDPSDTETVPAPNDTFTPEEQNENSTFVR